MPRGSRLIVLGPVKLPMVIAVLGACIGAASIAGAVTARSGAPALLQAGMLVTPAVWSGQLWRLVTFPLFEVHPLSLLFTWLALFWFGSDLVKQWGARRFLAIFFGLAAAMGAVTALVGLVWRAVALMPHAGSGPVLDALIVAWGLIHPGREIRLFGLFRLTGRWIARLTIGGTVLWALFEGFAYFVPHFAGELMALVWLVVVQPARARRAERLQALAARGEAWSFDRWYQKNARRR
jgi:membrane associated rhomboid family serine protease